MFLAFLLGFLGVFFGGIIGHRYALLGVARAVRLVVRRLLGVSGL